MLALADALEPDIDVASLVPRGDAALRGASPTVGIALDRRSGDTVERVDAQSTTSTAFDVVVLDGYVFDVALQRRLRDRAPLTVVDDLWPPRGLRPRGQSVARG